MRKKGKSWRASRTRIEMDFATFMRLVRTSEERRQKVAWYAGERARLIEACEEMEAKLRRQHESDGDSYAALCQTRDERDYWQAAYQDRDSDSDSERAVLIGRCERLQGALMGQTETVRQLTEERAAIHAAIRALRDTFPPWSYNAISDETTRFQAAFRALMARLPPEDGAAAEGE